MSEEMKKLLLSVSEQLSHNFGVAFVTSGLVLLGTSSQDIPFSATVLVSGFVLITISTLISLYQTFFMID